MPINARAGDQDIVHDREDTFATDPRAIFVPDPAVFQHSSFIQPHTTAVDTSGERNLVRVKILPAGLVDHLVRQIAKDVLNRI